jgi:iron complex transport system substrate-binding protein
VLRALVLVLLALGCSRSETAPPDPTAPPRIVSLTPSATEVVAALGATSLLVGVDDYSTYPAEVTALPKVGAFLTPNLEVILKLKPSIVLVDDVHGRTASALRDAGVEVVECPMHGLPDVRRSLASVGARIGKANEAQRLVDEIDRALEAAAAKRSGKRPRVLAIIDREGTSLGGLVAGGTGSWIDELLEVVGGENVLAGASVRYPKISLEEVVRAKPDVILDLSYAARAGLEAWSSVDVPATQQQRVVAISEQPLLAPSPRVTTALSVLAKALQ